MADTQTDQTQPLDAGHTTSEYVMTKVIVIGGTVLGVLGMASQFIEFLTPVLGQNKVFVLVAGCVALLTAAVKAMTYEAQRTALKKAAVTAGANAPTPTGNAAAAVLDSVGKTAALVLIATSLLFAGAAYADDITVTPEDPPVVVAAPVEAPAAPFLPQFAICNAAKTVCLAPAAAVVPFLIDVKTGNVGENTTVVFSVGEGINIVRGGLAYGADFLFGTSVNGGWNGAIMGKVGPVGGPNFKIGPVLVHSPGTPNVLTIGAGTGF